MFSHGLLKKCVLHSVYPYWLSILKDHDFKLGIDTYWSISSFPEFWMWCYCSESWVFHCIDFWFTLYRIKDDGTQLHLQSISSMLIFHFTWKNVHLWKYKPCIYHDLLCVHDRSGCVMLVTQIVCSSLA